MKCVRQSSSRCVFLCSAADGANAKRAHFWGLVQSAVELQTIKRHRNKAGEVIEDGFIYRAKKANRAVRWRGDI